MPVTRPLTACVARIWRTSKEAVCGAGFLASPGHVMTCAHVVNAALGRELLESDPPDAALPVDFPIAGTARIRGRVVEWRLPHVDAAVLRLEEPCPTDLHVRELLVMDDPSGRLFQALGFPDGFTQGRNESGMITGAVGGWSARSSPDW